MNFTISVLQKDWAASMSDEVLWELPDSWQWATIADLGDVVSGGTPFTKNPSSWNGEINWITPADLSGYSSKFIMRGAKSLTTEGLENSSARSSKKSDGRWRKFAYDELVARDKTSLDIFWLRDESLYDLNNPPEPDVLAAEIIENLEAGLNSFREILNGLGGEDGE